MEEIRCDFKEEMERHTGELEETAPNLSRRLRITSINAVIDEYVERAGAIPDARILYRLADVILREELTDPHPDKVTREEYPILSRQQLDRRERGETLRGDWNENRDQVVGYRKSFHESDNSGMQAINQALYKRS